MIYFYTFFNDWDNCNFKAAQKYILKSLPKGPPTQQMKWGIEVHSAFENRIKSGTPFPKEMEKYEKFVHFGPYRVKAELKVGIRSDGVACDFFDKYVKVRGKIDITVESAEGLETAVIIDVKTGKKREDPGEIELHAMMLKAQHPHLRAVYGHYLWLQEDALGKRHDLSDFSGKLASTQKKIDDVEHAIKMGFFPKNQNPLCGYCDVRTCEFNTVGKR